MGVRARLDHVAVAVADLAGGQAEWCGKRLAAARPPIRRDRFHCQHHVFGNGAVLELLSPPPGGPADNFVRRFVQRYGSTVHHLTLKVPDLVEAVGAARAYGLDVVDVDLADPRWREAFLRPSQVGGLVVQLASSVLTEPPTVGGGAEFVGVRLDVADLAGAGALWRSLGASVAPVPPMLECSWPGSAVKVFLHRHKDHVGPAALLFRNAYAHSGPVVFDIPVEES